MYLLGCVFNFKFGCPVVDGWSRSCRPTATGGGCLLEANLVLLLEFSFESSNLRSLAAFIAVVSSSPSSSSLLFFRKEGLSLTVHHFALLPSCRSPLVP